VINNFTRIACVAMCFLWLMPCMDAPAQEPSTSLLPLFLPQPRVQTAPLLSGVPDSQVLFQRAPQALLQSGSDLGTRGAIPAGSLGQISQSALGAVTGDGHVKILRQIRASLPSAVLQRVIHKLLIDQAFVRTSNQMERARALYALGYAADAAGAVVEGFAKDVAERALSASLLLAVRQNEQACAWADGKALPKDAAPEPIFELLEILAFCKLEQGSRDAAFLVSDLLSELGGGDALFFAALKLAADGLGALPESAKINRVRPIHMALLRRAGFSIDINMVDSLDPALLAVVAQMSEVGQEVRIAATERAVSLGLLPAKLLISLYETTARDESLLTQVAAGVAPDGPLTRAHLFALIAEAATPQDRLRFILNLYEQAHQAGVASAVAEAIGEDAAGVTPDQMIRSAAPLMVEILVRADRSRAALSWINLVEFPGASGAEEISSFAVHRMHALVSLSDPRLGVGVTAVALGTDARSGKLSKSVQAFVAREVVLAKALGDSVSSVLGGGSSGLQPPAPSVGAGSNVMAAIVPMAGQNIGGMDNQIIAAAASALVRNGFDVEARLMSVDALVSLSGK
jgi:hypothetical protein